MDEYYLTPEERKEEARKVYQKTVDKSRVAIRFSPRELSLLQTEMKKIGCENRTAYIKYKLFGFAPETKIEKLIKEKDPQAIGTLLRNEIMSLTDYFTYLRWRYEKEMTILYRQEEIDIKDWTKATNKLHVSMLEKLTETFTLIKDIAKELGIVDYFVDPSDNMAINIDDMTKEELDKLAEQIRKENISLGRPDTFM